MSDWDWDPETYFATMLDEIPDYEELQEAVVAATTDVEAERVLDLGTGSGETAARVWPNHPGAAWIGIDMSEPMHWVMDLPDGVADQLTWLEAAGFEAEANAVRDDLAGFDARLP